VEKIVRATLCNDSIFKVVLEKDGKKKGVGRLYLRASLLRHLLDILLAVFQMS
jgi:hypothetical protein